MIIHIRHSIQDKNNRMNDMINGNCIEWMDNEWQHYIATGAFCSAALAGATGAAVRRPAIKLEMNSSMHTYLQQYAHIRSII